MRTFRPFLLQTIKLITTPLFQYKTTVQPRYQKRQYQTPQNKNYTSNQTPIQKLDSSYWQTITASIEPQAAKVIRTILNPQSGQKQISRQLQQYLEFRNLTFTQNVRTDLGCAAVLVAMNQCPGNDNSDEYESRITDFITLTDLKNNPFDSVMLRHLITAINKRTNTNMQKNIRQYYRMRLVDILMDNFERLDNKDLLLLVKVIDESMEKDSLNFITKWRFYPLVQAIFNRLISYMQAYTQTSDYQKRESIERIIQPQLYHRIITLIHSYGHISTQHALIVHNFIVNRSSNFHSQHNIMFNFFNTLCYLPCAQVVQSSHLTTTIRKKLLVHFQNNYTYYSPFKKGWTGYPDTAKRYTIQRFFQDEFHILFKSLKFEKYQDKYLMLKKQHLKRPEIPQFIWQLVREDERLLTNKQILSYTITRLYPEKVSLKKEDWPNFSLRKISWAAENEANLKIWQALNKLGYIYKKQQFCAQRQVDILIDDDIVVQVDGEGHYNFLTNELSPETSYRNLQLLLSGYKLVVVSMFEYNNNRNIEDLQRIIREKLELVKDHGYVYVC